MGCGWEVLRGTWLVLCHGVDFLVLWISHIRSRVLQKNMAPFGQVKILLQSLADGKEPLEVAWVLNELKYFLL